MTYGQPPRVGVGASSPSWGSFLLWLHANLLQDAAYHSLVTNPHFKARHFFKRQVTKQATPCYLEEWPPLCLLHQSDSKPAGCDQCTICRHQEQSHQDCREVHSAPGHHADPDLTVSGPQMWGSRACRAPVRSPQPWMGQLQRGYRLPRRLLCITCHVHLPKLSQVDAAG